jgi:hypothetical protein
MTTIDLPDSGLGRLEWVASVATALGSWAMAFALALSIGADESGLCETFSHPGTAFENRWQGDLELAEYVEGIEELLIGGGFARVVDGLGLQLTIPRTVEVEVSMKVSKLLARTTS